MFHGFLSAKPPIPHGFPFFQCMALALPIPWQSWEILLPSNPRTTMDKHNLIHVQPEKESKRQSHLVGGLEHVLFSHILGIIIPIDFHIFQRGWNHQPAMMSYVLTCYWIWLGIDGSHEHPLISHLSLMGSMKNVPFFHSQVWRNNALKVGDSLVLTKPFHGGRWRVHGHGATGQSVWTQPRKIIMQLEPRWSKDRNWHSGHRTEERSGTQRLLSS